MLTEEVENAAKQKWQEFDRQDVFEGRCHHPAGPAVVERLDETDLERWELFAGGAQA